MEHWNMTFLLTSSWPSLSAIQASSPALITLIFPSLYKENIYVKWSMNKKNEGKKKLCICCCHAPWLFRPQTLMWLLCFVFCSFLFLWSELWADHVLLKCSNRSQRSTFFPFSPVLFSWPLQSTLGVVSLRLCPVLCLLTCVVHSCSPLLSWGASYTLKKKARRVTMKSEPNESIIPWFIWDCMRYTAELKMINSSFLCYFCSKSTHNPLHPKVQPFPRVCCKHWCLALCLQSYKMWVNQGASRKWFWQ